VRALASWVRDTALGGTIGGRIGWFNDPSIFENALSFIATALVVPFIQTPAATVAEKWGSTHPIGKMGGHFALPH
jgi:hypothetical protein